MVRARPGTGAGRRQDRRHAAAVRLRRQGDHVRRACPHRHADRALFRLSGARRKRDRPSGDLDRPPDRCARPLAQSRNDGSERAPRGGHRRGADPDRCRRRGRLGRRARAAAPSVRYLRRRPPRQHADRATKPAPPRRGCRRRAGEARHRSRPRRGVAHRRPRYRGARCSRRRPRGDREPRREFLRCGRRAGRLDGHCRTPWRRTLQGDQHRRQYDRPPHAPLRGLRLGRGPARRSRQSAGVAPVRAASHRGRGA